MASLRQDGLTILGSTGSVGASTLDVARRNPSRVRIKALTANSNHELLLRQCKEFKPELAVVADQAGIQPLTDGIRQSGLATRVAAGREGLVEAASLPGIDSVMAAIVGAAGLLPTMAAARSGKRVLLANKESVVMAGALLIDAIRDGGAELIPIDSEHNAIFQCLQGPSSPGEQHDGVDRLVLTASGGPFLDTPAADLDGVTPEQACAHPKWDMGRKISVDSATLMNKGLEVIEACCLFGMDVDRIEVLIHPQSIVHSLVQYSDGSTLAQLGNPDMRTPIAHALGWPDRIASGVPRLDLAAHCKLEFRNPDFDRFPCLRLAMEAARQGRGAPIVLNAVNEVAVAAFLDREISFCSIARIVESVLAQYAVDLPNTIEEVLDVDRRSRELAREKIACLRL
ncbi:MAG: 1-deoxy-D-xylulose-5-phosphate reductoisomerase [Gammaproteobacteria bacterium]